MFEYNYTVHLCVEHPSCAVALITDLLNITPKRSIGFGDVIQGGTPFKRTAVKTYWTCQLHDEQRLFSGTIKINDFLERQSSNLEKHREFFTRIMDEGGASYLRVEWFSISKTSSDQLDARTLWLLGKIRLGLQLDFSGPG